MLNQVTLAQTDDIQNNLVQVPPSPNSASLGKYGEVPVDLSTGVPSISIPLISINEGGIELPITLNYHAGGLKVTEEASWVGLGWSLSAGGAISRTIRGLPDDHPGSFLQNSMKVPTDRYIDYNLMTSSKALEMLMFLKDIADNKVDYEPDLFFFNTSKENGTFMFNNIASISTLPYSDVKITPIFDNSNLCGFELVDANGIIYYYGDTLYQSNYIEKTFSFSGGFHLQEYCSSWLIHSIINPFTKMRIDFNYSSYLTSSYIKPESKLYQRTTLYTNDYALLPSSPIYINARTNIKILKDITINDNIIEFISSLRNDLDGKKLDSIKFNKKCFVFETDYFKVNNSSNDQNTLRLKLNGIKEFDIINPTVVKKYEFQYYYDITDDELKLPPKDSYSIDHWGFYNGKQNTTTAIPTINYGLITFPGADRSPDPAYSKACTLRQITYPTGGNTEFVYENNTYSRLQRIDEVAEHQTSELAQLISDTYTTNWIDTTININFEPEFNYLNYSIFFSFQNSEPLPDPGYPIPGEFGLYVATVDLINVNDNISVFHAQIDKDNFQNVNVEIEDIDPSDIYQLKIRLRRAIGEASAYLKYDRYDPDDLLIEKDDYAGGLRIKQLINSSLSNIKEYKTYDYSLSGYLCRPFPIYYTTSSLETYDEQGDLVSYPRILTYASPVGGLGSSSNSVSYNKVVEYFGTVNSNFGKKITFFPQIMDEPLNGEFTPVMNFQSKRSIPLREEFYTKNINNYELSKYIDYNYEVDPDHYTAIDGFRASVANTSIASNLLDMTSLMNYGKYTIAIDRTRLSKKIDWSKMANGAISNEINYIYESKVHLNPTRIKTFLNTDHTEILEEFYKYPPDYLPDPIDCNSYYNQSINDCQLILDTCQIESNICNSIYGACFTPWLDCRRRTFLRYEDLIIANVGFDPYKCKDVMVECLEDNGYYSCIGGLKCGLIPCIVSAAQDYYDCEATNLKTNLDLYQNCQNSELKTIYLLSLLHQNNKVIEKTIKHNGIITNNLIYNYKSLLLSDSSQLPVLKNIIDKLNNEMLIVYDSISRVSNIIQMTEKGKCPISYGWGYNQKYLISQTVNSTSNECSYTGFENEECNGWLNDHNEFKNSEHYTGNSSIKISGGMGVWKEFKIGMNANNHVGYEASVWIKNSNKASIEIDVKGNNNIRAYADNEFGNGSDWNLLRVKLPKDLFENLVDSSFTIIATISCSEGEAFFDDLRFQPIDAQMTSYTYKPFVGTTSVSDINNKAESYEYDGFGRLILVKDFQGNITKKYDYHYKPQQ